MSLQQTNVNKFPKHIQHARLQKEEDEEQWISGEELCTDGSSDEDTNPSDIKKKSKSRTIYFPTKDSGPVKKTIFRASDSSSLNQNNEDLDCAGNSQNTTPNLTQWRPKRGSIKLPNIDEKPLDIETEKWNTETEYNETFKRLTAFNNDIVNNNVQEVNSLDEDWDILHFDNEIEKFDKIYQECKQDRMNFQKEVCREIKTLNKSSLEHKNTQKFLELFKFQINEDNSANETTTKPKKCIQILKSIFKKDIQFPVKSTRKMAVSLLSEEEKTRLNFLLSDIEIDEIDSMENQNDVLECDLEETKSENAFQSTEEELQDLEIIEHKLKTLQEHCENANIEGKISEDSVDEENREWKTYLKNNDDKIRKINTKLVKLKECNSETSECVE